MSAIDTSRSNAEESLAIEVNGLTKIFGPTVALNNISLKLTRGATLLIAGPNGSGKSTFLKIICGIINRPREAKVLVLGFDPWKKRHLLFNRMSASFEDFGFSDFVSGFDYLRFVCDLRRITTIPESFANGEFFGIASFWTNPIKTYSSGMRRKLAIIQALLSSPELLVLDEPLVALDRKSREELIVFLQQRKIQGKTTIISSHILTGLEQVVTDVVVLVDGNIRALVEGESRSINLESVYSRALESG